jgi:hypothetical protein
MVPANGIPHLPWLFSLSLFSLPPHHLSLRIMRSSVRSNAGEITAACRLIRRMIARSGTPTSTMPRPAALTGAHELALLSSIAATLTEDKDKPKELAVQHLVDHLAG